MSSLPCERKDGTENAGIHEFTNINKDASGSAPPNNN
jgi:hypothetical protein